LDSITGPPVVGERQCLRLNAIVWAAVSPAAFAKESAASAKDAEQYLAKGDLKSAELKLCNASRQRILCFARVSPQVYLQLGDPAAAEREVEAALSSGLAGLPMLGRYSRAWSASALRSWRKPRLRSCCKS
jgi:hypothetical protein